ncbi:hypothetical protein J2R98_000453 [Alkalibacillus filiformis]|uniref:Uncharacterized protein n=1 Tax=Alkalibacillus filiformis TaxID=200990 RepID=A0ABU0DR26_9BACI|nr:hypothetical protein [Alkalibacillus filiformis]MDQ0350650.1 hypothetical protein [Alkalibacillus filiformis]
MEIIYLVLHGVALFAIFWLFIQLRQSNEAEQQSEQRVQEIEDLFNSYLLEIKDENKKLLEQLSRVEQTNQHPSIANNDQDQPSNKISVEEREHNVDYPSLSKDDYVEFDLDHVISEQKDQLELSSQKQGDYEQQNTQSSLQNQVLNLINQGYSIETTAKKLNLGYTEVELIVKFNHKMTI